PEDVRSLLAPYWQHLRDELERYGGTVEKFIGDAVMALFGAPVAHEDDPERAVRAALAIRDWAREEDDLQVRIAVNTGEAVVLLGVAEADPEFSTGRRGRPLSYGEGISLWALGEMVKSELGVLESDSREETANKLAESVAELVADDDERGWLESQLAPLVGLPSQAVAREQRFGAWRRWVEALAEQRPLVLVFEDLQWADDELLDFVDELADWASEVPLLIVCTTRP